MSSSSASLSESPWAPVSDDVEDTTELLIECPWDGGRELYEHEMRDVMNAADPFSESIVFDNGPFPVFTNAFVFSKKRFGNQRPFPPFRAVRIAERVGLLPPRPTRLRLPFNQDGDDPSYEERKRDYEERRSDVLHTLMTMQFALDDFACDTEDRVLCDVFGVDQQITDLPHRYLTLKNELVARSEAKSPPASLGRAHSVAIQTHLATSRDRLMTASRFVSPLATQPLRTTKASDRNSGGEPSEQYLTRNDTSFADFLLSNRLVANHRHAPSEGDTLRDFAQLNTGMGVPLSRRMRHYMHFWATAFGPIEPYVHLFWDGMQDHGMYCTGFVPLGGGVTHDVQLGDAQLGNTQMADLPLPWSHYKTRLYTWIDLRLADHDVFKWDADADTQTTKERDAALRNQDSELYARALQLHPMFIVVESQDGHAYGFRAPDAWRVRYARALKESKDNNDNKDTELGTLLRQASDTFNTIVYERLLYCMGFAVEFWHGTRKWIRDPAHANTHRAISPGLFEEMSAAYRDPGGMALAATLRNIVRDGPRLAENKEQWVTLGMTFDHTVASKLMACLLSYERSEYDLPRVIRAYVLEHRDEIANAVFY